MKYLLLPLAVLLTACTTEGTFKLPGVYRIDIQQGAIIDGDMLARLKPGMDKNQVQFIMGTPPLVDPFHADRWDYVYTFSKGGHQRKQRHITLHFEDDKLAHIDGDVTPGAERPDELTNKPTKIVEVPIRQYKKRGFFGKLVDKLPFVGDPQADTPEGALNEETEVEPDTQVDEGP
ncbi:MAG: outer membrane protein assembly factor BamE [Gammaproteobacteria bacterium]|nr:outer membrane protein assembly factor BamE [Gammaproteobacteria bacterium]MCY4281962.1 outer membrane protein assembly factor BamE [Gammaproteobacteria bacterium]MCY4338230.1 outer membrane protein assembly factor BamE [Gammaproteobacteria bacterium]